MVARGVVLVAACGLLLACDTPADVPDEEPPAPAPAESSVRLPDVLSNDYDPQQIVVRVNGQPIVRRELESTFRTELVARRAKGIQTTPMEMARLRAKTLERLIDSTVIYQHQKQNGLSISPERIAAAIGEVKAGFESEEAFQAHLDEQGVNTAHLKTMAEVDLANIDFVEQLRSEATASDEEARAVYDANPEMFRIPEEIFVAHILITLSPTASPDEERAAWEKAKDIATQARAEDGPPWEELVRTHSDDPQSRDAGGDIGSFSVNVPDQQGAKGVIINTVRNMEEGGVSDPVRTEMGFHVLTVTKRKPPHTRPFDDVAGTIKSAIIERKAMARYAEELQKLRAAAQIERYSLLPGDVEAPPTSTAVKKPPAPPAP